MTAQDASFETVTSSPSDLKKPFSWPMTIDEQSVSAMMPMRIFATSGASDAKTLPRHPTGNCATSAPSADSFRSSRRVTVVDAMIFLFDTFRFLSQLGVDRHRSEAALWRSEQNGAGACIERGVVTRTLETTARRCPHDGAAEVRAAPIEGHDVAVGEPNGERRAVGAR